jgi:hypothetical protein
MHRVVQRSGVKGPGAARPGLHVRPEPHEGPAVPAHRLGEPEAVAAEVENLLRVPQPEQLGDLLCRDQFR